MIESEARYLDRITEDCAQLLGPGVEIDGLDVGTEDGPVLRLSYRLGAAAGMSEGRGESLLAAHADLRQNIVVDRIGLAVRAMMAEGDQEGLLSTLEAAVLTRH